MLTRHKRPAAAVDVEVDVRHTEALLKAGALQSAIFNSANFSSIATDAKGVIQISWRSSRLTWSPGRL